MKKEFLVCPEEFKDENFYGFDWLEHLTAIPQPLVLVTGYKQNGKANATMQSWFSFSNDGGFYCVFSYICKNTHMYEVAAKSKQLVINFPTADVYKKCYQTIQNNDYDADELAASGLSSKPAAKVNAPIADDCPLNLECEYVWEKEINENSDHVVLCVKVVNVHIDEKLYKEGRYGEKGYLYNIHSPIDPESGRREDTSLGIVKHYMTYEELMSDNV